MEYFKRLAALLLVFISLSADAQNEKEIDVVSIVDKEMNKVYPANEPGAAIVIMRGDSIIMNKGYGLADINTKTKITPATNFNIASISKMFTATAILLLAEKGKLNLQDPIIKYLPDVNPQIGNKITIYHLLTHTSGLPHFIPTKDSATRFTVMDQETYDSDKNIDSLDFEPGTRFGYSNVGYRWLALITEKVSGVDFGDFVRKNVFLKAGMTNSYEMNRDAPIINFAHAYQKTGNEFIEFDYGEEEQFGTLGDGGVVSSTNDLISWEKALRSYKVLSQKSFEETITPHINSGLVVIGSSYGFGWFIQKSPNGGPMIYSHSGADGGFAAYLLRIPEKQIMVAFLSNRSDHVIDVAYSVQSLLRKAGWY